MIQTCYIKYGTISGLLLLCGIILSTSEDSLYAQISPIPEESDGSSSDTDGSSNNDESSDSSSGSGDDDVDDDGSSSSVIRQIQLTAVMADPKPLMSKLMI
jgi:hypothetical protein